MKNPTKIQSNWGVSLPPMYAGVGSRNTPPEILTVMDRLGENMAAAGWVLRSGNCKGADQAFQRGANRINPMKVTVFMPYKGYGGRRNIHDRNILVHEHGAAVEECAAHYHPAWEQCNHQARMFHVRNTQIVLGRFLNQPVEKVICWTPNEERGGTSQAIRIARDKGIPVHNLYGMSPEQVIENFKIFTKKPERVSDGGRDV